MSMKQSTYPFAARKMSIMNFVVTLITILLAIVVPCFAKGLLISDKERAYEAHIVKLFHDHAPTLITSVSKVFAFIFSTKISIVILALLAVFSWFLYKNWKLTLVQLLICLLPMLYIFAVKFVVHRPRPNIGIKVQLPPDPSFPSGHTAAAVAICSLIVLMIYVSKPHFLQLSILISGFVVILVALSRLVVAAHFPTDVLTSAIMYPLLVITLLYRFQHHGLYVSYSDDQVRTH